MSFGWYEWSSQAEKFVKDNVSCVGNATCELAVFIKNIIYSTIAAPKPRVLNNFDFHRDNLRLVEDILFDNFYP